MGTPVVYAATTLSLAALEILGHVDPAEARPSWSYRLELPDDAVERLSPERLPRGWNAARPRAATARMGGAWAEGGRSLALLVPSVHLPGAEELIILLNPRHAAWADVKISAPRLYRFDARLLPR